MALTKKQRAELQMKFGGRCAYCGCELGDKWHADHVEAVRRNISNGYAMDRPENDTVSNMVPACIPCNLFKMCSTVEDFRSRIATQVDVTRRASRSYRTAESFGLVQPTNAPVVFWFEKYQAEGANQ
ncbi:HNH endonuclease [Klebsiella pneumoniae]|uniref:HNH endonuclease n=1 Tax=Klebsiella pneumoniae TaxID=573 RepID=UPI001955289A|nr:HNH endonuclease [Klebsiella pneumoniae]